MLSWMNLSTSIAAQYGIDFAIKCHCSKGQACPDYPDPRTGQPIDFNFLPVFSDPRLGLMPHTVQMYSFDDPAPTYGNVNFDYMFNFTVDFAGTRPVFYHPESAYWVWQHEQSMGWLVEWTLLVDKFLAACVKRWSC
eukprot:m.292018 g.292018  ORF g.292018 m.292018 type:complete len:137 (-) comp19481_c0_seq5:276-686(-)